MLQYNKDLNVHVIMILIINWNNQWLLPSNLGITIPVELHVFVVFFASAYSKTLTRMKKLIKYVLRYTDTMLLLI